MTGTDVRGSGARTGLVLLALAAGGFSIGTTEFATMGLLPYIAHDLAITIPQAGYVITAYALGVVVGAPVLTSLAARVDRRTLLLWLMGMFTIANTISAFAPSAGWLVAARFVAGLPHGAFFGVGAVMGAAVVGPGRRGRAVAMMMAGLTIANVVGVPLSTLLGHVLGWRAAFVAVGVLGLVTFVGLRSWLPSLPSHAEATVRTELRALRNPQLWIAFGAAGIGFGGMFAVYSYVSPLLTQVTGLTETTVPLVLALFGVGMTLGTVVGGRLADRSVLRTVYLGFATTIVVLVAIAVTARIPALAIAAIVALGVSSQILGLSLQTRLMDVSPAAPSLGAALCHSALNLGNASGAWLGGLVIAAGHGLVAPAWVGTGLTAAGLLVVVTVGRAPAPHASAPHASAPRARALAERSAGSEPSAPSGAEHRARDLATELGADRAQEHVERVPSAP
ncbi:MFS transporter [Cellulomonas sp. P24]|uniref:MFS transporter n=1 Tax=Cellulomonas sp. P24 TaxID=2885206 RepID=UPI00216AB9EA|nr:MFS transporter [Cellulomonas sp. P24]MCR6494066.1 MFS transporter [Cellulomonas sp. P24]